MIRLKKIQLLLGFLLILPIVIYSQVFLLQDHLKFGFSDVDWGFILFFKNFTEHYPNPIANFIETFKHWGVYAHQSYYIGPQYLLFGLDFEKYQIIIHIFKILGILLVYPFMFLFTGSLGIAILTTVLFAFSYPAVGTMYTVVTSSDYTAVISFLLFAIYYIYLIKKEKSSLLNLLILSGLLLVTLFLSTERFYPIMFVIPFVEIIYARVSKNSWINKESLKRLFIMYFPALAAFLYEPWLFIDFIWRGVSDYVIRIQGGEWHVLLTPFISMGSLILPHNYWKYLGVLNLNSLGGFSRFLLDRPLMIFGSVTFLMLIVIKRKLKFFLGVFVSSVISFYILYLIVQSRPDTFSVGLFTPAMIGVYYLIISVFVFIDWLTEPKQRSVGLFAGPIFAFMFIFLTWIASESYLIFSGVHRYLTLPGFGHSVFLGSFIYLLIKKLGDSKLRMFKYLPLIILAPVLVISSEAITTFFSDHIKHGFGARDQQYMRSQLLSYLDNYDQDDPSLFYFDFSEDNLNGYYYDNTIMGGFKTWMMFTDQVNFNDKIEPSDFWNNPELLEEISVTKDGQEVFLYEKKVIPKDNLYAFKLKNKKVIENTDEVLSEINFE